MATPEAIVKSVFGYEGFRPLQREVIQNVLEKQDTLAVMPTGAGKSLCYQVPALIFEGLTVVVSPLISLMQDQVRQLQELGVSALFLNSSLDWEQYQQNMQRVRRSEARLLYVSPETLLTDRVKGLLGQVRLDCLTIDEAHCISEWGHDFRPEYRQLAAVRQLFPAATCLALTATATLRVRQDIKASLSFPDGSAQSPILGAPPGRPNEFVASFNRENLLIEVVPKHKPLDQALEFVGRFPRQSGIIYCFSRQQVDDLAAALQDRGHSVLPYHAGLTDEVRRRNQEAFTNDDVQIIVATIAFGMGINKPNVRFILHYDLPKSIESYYHEIGRAGRDGLPACCRLLYSYGDAQKIRYLISQKQGTEVQVAQAHLDAMLKYADSDICRRVPLLAYFGEQFTTENCAMCDVCRAGQQELVDITIPAQKFLSCVKRTGEKFGAGHVVDVLLGSQNEKVRRYEHQELSTYGIGKELSRQQWMHVGRQLLQKGLLAKEGQYSILKLTPRAYQALKERQQILGVLQEAQAPAPTADEQPAYDAELFELLRALRKELAQAAQVPPYVVFSDRTLIEMATFYPNTPALIKTMYGMGQRKFERYGRDFLAQIASYCQARNLQPRRKLAAGRPRPEKTLRYVEVGQMYNQGHSIEQIMAAFNIQQGTVISYLTRYLLEGNPLRATEGLPQPGIPPDLQARALQSFEKLGAQYLKPVFDDLLSLGEAVSYDDLKVLRLYYLSQNSPPANLLDDGFPP